MTSGREQRSAPMRVRWRSLTRDGGVSPVVGMVLVLLISVLGIAAILLWGVPAIDSMKAQVEFRSVQTQFHELDSTLRELVAGTAGKTAKRWQPSLSRGGIEIDHPAERWVIAIDRESDYNLTYHNVGRDNRFAIVNHGSAAVKITVNASIIDGSAAIKANVSRNGDVNHGPAPADRAQMTTAQAVTLDPGDYHYFKLYRAGAGWWADNAQTEINPNVRLNLDGITLHIEVKDRDLDRMASEAWVFDVGAIRYELWGTGAPMRVYSSNGAIITGQGTGTYIDNQPPIPAPRDAAGSHRFFARMVAINGEGSFAGEGRFDILLSLYGTTTLADKENVVRAKIWIDGDLTLPWWRFFTDETRNYGFHDLTEAGGDGDRANYLLYNYPAGMTFTLVQSVITATT